MAVLEIQREVDGNDLPSDDTFQSWADEVLSDKPEAEVVIRIVDEAEIQHLNLTFRHKDYATNVLSFPFEAPAPIELPLLGDLAICASVVAKEAAEQGKSLEAHWAHMIIHGIFNLLGYDHIEEDQAQEMEQLEIEALARLGFPDPYNIK